MFEPGQIIKSLTTHGIFAEVIDSDASLTTFEHRSAEFRGRRRQLPTDTVRRHWQRVDDPRAMDRAACKVVRDIFTV